MAGGIRVKAHTSAGHFVKAHTRAKTSYGSGHNYNAQSGDTNYIAATRGNRQRIARFSSGRGDRAAPRGAVFIHSMTGGATTKVRQFKNPTTSSLGRLSRMHWLYGGQNTPAAAAGRRAQIAMTKRIYGRFGG